MMRWLKPIATAKERKRDRCAEAWKEEAKSKMRFAAVVDGSGYSLRVCGVEVSECLTFDGAEGPFWITLVATEQ